MHFEFQNPTRLIFGAGVLKRLGGELAHEIVMQHEGKMLLDEFCADLKKDARMV